MKFETRNVGVFEVLAIRLEGQEVFDAGRLRQAVTELVEAGQRRLIVDLSEVDYLYSDSINAFIAVNRRMIESSGRLGVLVPNPKVHEILLRAGIENILRIYRNEGELVADSREIMRQSSSYSRPADFPDGPGMTSAVAQTYSQPAVHGGNSTPEDSGSYRMLRRRSGARTEVRPRRQGGRALDVDYDSELPPELPELKTPAPAIGRSGSDNATLRQPNPPRFPEPPPPRKSDVPEFVLPDGTVFDPGLGSDAVSFDLTGPGDSAPGVIGEGRESAFLDSPISQAAVSAHDTPSTAPSVAGGKNRDESSFRSDFSWDEPSGLAGISDHGVSSTQPPPGRSASLEGHRPIQESPRAVPAAPSSPPPQDPFARGRLVGRDEDLPTQILSVVSLERTPQVIPPPEPIAAPRVVAAPPPPEPIAAPRVVAAPPPPEPIAAPRVIAAPPPPEPIAAPRVIAAPPPEPIAAPRVVAAPPPPAPIAAPRVVAAPPPEPIAAPRVVAAPPPPEPIAAPRSVTAPVPPAPVVRIGPVEPPPEPIEHIPAPEPIRPARRAATGSSVFKTSGSSSAVRPVPTKAKRTNTGSSSAVRARGEREAKSPVLWIVLGGVILLFGIGSWIWLGRTPTPEIPSPSSEVAVAPPVVDPTPTPVEPVAPPVVEPKVVPQDQADAEDAPATGDARTLDAKSLKKDPKKDLKPLPPPPPPEPDPADKKTEKVFVTSRPSGAKVVLDGKSIGKTPIEVEIKGNGRLTLSLDGYKDLEKAVRVADVRGTLNLVLEAEAASAAAPTAAGPTGKFFLSSSPAGAEVFVDGKLVGKTPKMVELPAGNHKLNLRSGALEKSLDVELNEGANPAKHVPL